jgi:small-conductance mechanosensitive channel
MDRERVLSDIRFRIDGLFREAGIVIAFPQRDVHIHPSAPLPVQVLAPASDAAPLAGTLS